MNWKQLLESVPESVNDELRLRHDYLVAENRILRNQIDGRVNLTDSQRKELAEIGAKLGKQALAEMTLNRPQALNALNDAMRETVLPALPDFASDSEIYAVIVRSNSPRAFCAGGDVRELTELARRDPSLAAASIGQEYFMNWALECFTKPTVSLIDGMEKGSGVGLML